MSQFTCHGPFKIPTEKWPNGKVITSDHIKSFWAENPDYSGAVGCYIFAMRTGRGIAPLYVGKATKSFCQESFAPHKLQNYLRALATYMRGTPVMFFIAYPAKKKGVTNLKHISALEKFLIQQAAIANPDYLWNINHTSQPRWGIAGVLRSETTKPTNGAAAFKAMLRF